LSPLRVAEAVNKKVAVLVVDKRGVSRGPALVIYYIMKTMKISLLAAFSLVKVLCPPVD